MLKAFLLLISFCCVLTNLYGASVTARSKKKLLVKIDEGGDTGFSKGLKVCFYNASGKKLGCGKIVSAGDSSARVRVSKRTVRRLKKGVTAKLANVANSATAVVLAASENMKLRFFYLLTPVQGYQINQLSYLPPGDLPAQSLWATTEVSKSSFVGGGLDFEIPMGGGNAISLGLRYRMNNPSLVSANFDDNIETHYVDSQQTLIDLGGWIDYYFFSSGSLGLTYRFSTGLDFAASTATFVATKKLAADESDVEELANHSSSLNLASLRLGFHIQSFLDPVGFTFTIQPIVPIAVIGTSVDSLVSDSKKSLLENAVTGEQDLELALGHGKSSFGVEIIFASYIGF